MLTHVVKNGSTTLYSQTVARDQQLKDIRLRNMSIATARQARLRFGFPSSTTVSESRPYQSTSCCANSSGNPSQRADGARQLGDGCPGRSTRRAKRRGRPVGRGARQYDAFGQFVLPSHPTTLTFGFTWKGYFYDADVELYYLGYRFYSPKTGRFLTRDPIGEAGGLNLYDHVRGDAINHYDILGLSAAPVNAGENEELPGVSYGRTIPWWAHPQSFNPAHMSDPALLIAVNDAPFYNVDSSGCGSCDGGSMSQALKDCIEAAKARHEKSLRSAISTYESTVSAFVEDYKKVQGLTALADALDAAREVFSAALLAKATTGILVAKRVAITTQKVKTATTSLDLAVKTYRTSGRHASMIHYQSMMLLQAKKAHSANVLSSAFVYSIPATIFAGQVFGQNDNLFPSASSIAVKAFDSVIAPGRPGPIDTFQKAAKISAPIINYLDARSAILSGEGVPGIESANRLAQSRINRTEETYNTDVTNCYEKYGQ